MASLLTAVVNLICRPLLQKYYVKNYTIKVLATPDTDQTCKSPQVLARQVFHIQHRCDPSTHNLNAFPVIYRNTEEWEREESRSGRPSCSAFISSPHCPLPSPHLFICCTPLTGLKWELKSIHMKVQTKAGCVTTILLSQWCILNTIDDFPDTDWANNPITDIMSFNAAYFISQSLLLKMEQNGCYIKAEQMHLREANRCLPVHLFILFLAGDRKWWEGGEWDLGMSRARLKHTLPTWAPRLNASDYVQ